MKTFLTSLLILGSVTLFAQFSDYYDPGNWTQTNSSSCDDGYVDASGAPASITIWSSDDPECSRASQITRYIIAIEACGTISFNWHYTTFDCDGSSFDQFGYMLNGSPTQLSANGLPDGSSQYGSTSVPVVVGDVFAFYMNATDNFCGRGRSIISDFSGPACDLELIVEDPGTLYYGYGPLSCTNVVATASSSNGPVTITGDGEVCATDSECIEVTVTATDEACCTVSVTFIIPVVDATCSAGNGQPKVQICHNGHTICVSPNAVQAHLDHGDVLGGCEEGPECMEESSMQASTEYQNPEDAQKEAQLSPRNSLVIPSLDAFNELNNDQTDFNYIDISPNPANEVVSLTVNRGMEGVNQVSVYNVNGQLVQTFKENIVVGVPFQLEIGDLNSGNYTVTIVSQNGHIMNKNLIIRKE